MKHKKLIFFLEGLQKNDKILRACTKHLKYSIGYSDPNLFALFDYLRKHPNLAEAKNFDEEKIFQKVMPKGAKFNGQLMRLMTTNLSQHIEQFIVQGELEKSPYLKNKLLAEGMNTLKMDEQYFRLTFGNIEKTLPKDEADKHLAKAQLYNDLYFHPKAPLHNAKVYRDHLDAAMDNLDIYYAIKRLKYACEVLSREVIYGEELEEAFFKELRDFLAFLPETENLLVKVLSSATRFFFSPSVEKYEQVKAMFIEYLDEIHSEKLVVLQFLFNALFVLDYPGGRIPEYFKLSKLGIDKGIFIKNGYISSDNFNNIVHISCHSKEFEWAKVFIDKYVGYLDDTIDTLENLKTLYNCYILYGQKHNRS